MSSLGRIDYSPMLQKQAPDIWGAMQADQKQADQFYEEVFGQKIGNAFITRSQRRKECCSSAWLGVAVIATLALATFTVLGATGILPNVTSQAVIGLGASTAILTVIDIALIANHARLKRKRLLF